MKRIILAAAFSLAAAPVLAFQCPADIAAIDAALNAGPNLSEAQIAEVKTLRDQGEQLHSAGQHQQSVDTLAKAKAILGL